MTTTHKAGYVISSLAKAFVHRQRAKALVKLEPPGRVFTEIPIKDLPLYRCDYDADYPPVARAFKQATRRRPVHSARYGGAAARRITSDTGDCDRVSAPSR